MRLKSVLAKIGIGVSLAAVAALSHASIEDSLEYFDADDYGNIVYFASSKPKQIDFIMVDGSATVGMYSSANVATIAESGQAGYAVVPASNFEDMSRNAQFAKIYTVDCDRYKIKNEMGEVMRLDNASAFHQTSAGMACSVLK